MMTVVVTVLSILCTVVVANLPCYAIADDLFHFNYGATAQSEIYTKDRVSLQLISGALFSCYFPCSRNPVFNYAQTNLRIGWMLNSPDRSESFLRGNYEAIFELSNSIIYKGPGNYIGGVTALIRYNFVQPESKLIPYVQAGAGIVYTDAYKDHSQDAIGQAIEFTPQASLGLHCQINKNWSIDAEAMFHHISNAYMADRNVGLNAIGGFIGLTYFHDRLWI